MISKSLKNLTALLFSATISAQAFGFTPDVSYDAPDADLLDGVCADIHNKCTLRAAVQQANLEPGLAGIVLSDNTSYFLESPLIITGNIFIFTPPYGSGAATIEAAPGKNTRLIQVKNGADFRLGFSRLTGGRLISGDDGGGVGGAAIYVEHGAKAYLEQVEITNNFVDRKNGGAIFNFGELEIHYSNISDNTVSDFLAPTSPQTYVGGAIANGGKLQIRGSSLINNSARKGGAIASLRGPIDEFEAAKTLIIGSTLHNNRASHDGAAIFASFSDVEIIGSTIFQNGKNFPSESERILPDVAAISSPVGSARYDHGIVGDEHAGAALFGAHCSGCHTNLAIKANRYSEIALFAYIDSVMAPTYASNCNALCAQHIAKYLTSNLYPPTANLEKDILFPSTPVLKVFTSIVVNNGDFADIPEIKKGRSIPQVYKTLWDNFPSSSDVSSVYDFDPNYWPYQDGGMKFELRKTTSIVPGINTVVARPYAGPISWKESLFMAPCKDLADAYNLSQYNSHGSCQHAEIAGNEAHRQRATFRQNDLAHRFYSLGAWEDYYSN